jgi:hypothetical protein
VNHHARRKQHLDAGGGDDGRSRVPLMATRLSQKKIAQAHVLRGRSKQPGASSRFLKPYLNSIFFAAEFRASARQTSCSVKVARHGFERRRIGNAALIRAPISAKQPLSSVPAKC